MRKLINLLVLGSVGGFIYGAIEILFRGYTHYSMMILGGICFILVGLINEYLEWDTPLILQMLIATAIIVTLEFISGLILNVWLGLDIWDYSNQWGNVLGQICPLFTGVWFLLSLPAILLDDWLRYYALGEEKPHYKFF